MAIVKLDKIQSVNINSLPIRVSSNVICENNKKISYCLSNSKFKNRNYNFILKQEFFIIFQCPLDGEQFKAGGFSVRRPQSAPCEVLHDLPKRVGSGVSRPTI